MSNKTISGHVPADAEARMRYNGYVLFLPDYNKPTYESLPATLVIGPGKVFTEEEVKAMLDDMKDTMNLESECSFDRIAAKHGLTL